MENVNSYLLVFPSFIIKNVFGPPTSPRDLSGKVRVWPAEGRKPQDKANYWKGCKRSQSLNTISTSDQSRHTRERQSTSEKHLARSKQSRAKGAEKDLRKKLPTCTDLPLRNEGAKKQPLRDTTPVLRPSINRVLKSRLAPPRPAKDIILENRTIILSQNFLSDEAPYPDISGVLEKESSSSDSALEQQDISAADPSQEKDGNTEDGRIHYIPRQEKHSTHDAGTQTSWNDLEESKSEAQLAETHQPAFKGAITNELDLNQYPESKLDPEVNDSSLPERSETPEELEELKSDKPIQVDHVQIPEAHPERPETNGPMATVSAPEEMWTALEKMFQSRLQGAADQVMVAEVSRTFSEILSSLYRWSSDLENTLRPRLGNDSNQNHSGEQRSTKHVRNPRYSIEGGLLLMDITAQNLTPQGSKYGEVGPTGPPRVNSALEMVGPSGSTSDPPTNHKQESKRCVLLDESSGEEETGSNPAEETFDAALRSSSEDFVFIETYFAEPFKPSTMESRSDLSSDDSSSQNQISFLGSTKGPKERRSQMTKSESHFRQSSKVRRLIETTAEEIKAMAIPELALLSLQEGRRRAADKLPRSNTGPLEEQSAGDMDSCEEAEEEEVVQTVSRSALIGTEDVVKDVEVLPATSSVKTRMGQQGLRLVRRRYKTRDCKVS